VTGPAVAFRVMLRMEIHPGMEAEFEEVWTRIGDGITSHPANLGQWLSRGVDEPGVYYVVSDWVDEPRFREFEHSEQHLRHRTALHPYRSAGSMTTMQVVREMAGSAREPAAGRVRVLVHAAAPSTGPEEVSAAYHAVSRELAGTPGLLGNELLRSVSDPDRFAVLSEWRDPEAFEEWERGAAHRATTAPFRPLQTDGGGAFGVYEVVDRYA